MEEREKRRSGEEERERSPTSPVTRARARVGEQGESNFPRDGSNFCRQEKRGERKVAKETSREREKVSWGGTRRKNFRRTHEMRGKEERERDSHDRKFSVAREERRKKRRERRNFFLASLLAKEKFPSRERREEKGKEGREVEKDWEEERRRGRTRKRERSGRRERGRSDFSQRERERDKCS